MSNSPGRALALLGFVCQAADRISADQEGRSRHTVGRRRSEAARQHASQLALLLVDGEAIELGEGAQLRRQPRPPVQSRPARRARERGGRPHRSARPQRWGCRAHAASRKVAREGVLPRVNPLEPLEPAQLRDHAHGVVEQVVTHVDAPEQRARLDACGENKLDVTRGEKKIKCEASATPQHHTRLIGRGWQELGAALGHPLAPAEARVAPFRSNLGGPSFRQASLPSRQVSRLWQRSSCWSDANGRSHARLAMPRAGALTSSTSAASSGAVSHPPALRRGTTIAAMSALPSLPG